MKLKLPNFETEKELFEHIVKNEEAIFTQAKMEMKKADGLGFDSILLKKDVSEKAVSVEDLLAKDVLEAKLAINTTNVIDSHKDLHIPGLWDKSLKENKHIPIPWSFTVVASTLYIYGLVVFLDEVLPLSTCWNGSCVG